MCDCDNEKCTLEDWPWLCRARYNQDPGTDITVTVASTNQDHALDLAFDKAHAITPDQDVDMVKLTSLEPGVGPEVIFDYTGTTMTDVAKRDDDRIQMVCRVLKDRGYTADYEFPGFICVQQGGIEFNAGTANTCWGMDITNCWIHLGIAERKDLTEQSDVFEVADWIVSSINHTHDRIHGLREA